VLELKKLYSDLAAGLISDYRHLLDNFHKSGGKSGVKDLLEDMAESFAGSFKNSYKAAFCKAAANSEWYCDGGFKAI